MTATASAEALTATDLEAEISAAEKLIDKLTSEQKRLSLATLRHEDGAAEAVVEVEKALDAARHAHRLASDAIIALGAEEAQAEVAHAAESRVKLEAVRAEKLAAKAVAINDFDAMVSDLCASVKAALSVSDEAHNAGVALGIHGNPVATSRALEGRIHHALREDAGLLGFDFAVNPAFRHPLGTNPNAIPARDPIPPQATPLPERRDVREEAGYPGQNLESRPITATFLKDAEGNWISVEPGRFEFPNDPPEPQA